MIIRKQVSLIAIFLLSAVLMGGCLTTRSVSANVTQGATNTWQGVLTADEWIRKNMW